MPECLSVRGTVTCNGKAARHMWAALKGKLKGKLMGKLPRAMSMMMMMTDTPMAVSLFSRLGLEGSSDMMHSSLD